MSWLSDLLSGLFSQRAAAQVPVAVDTEAQPSIATLRLADLYAAGVTEPQASQFLPSLISAMREGDIVTPQRAAMFLAQVAWESNHFRNLVEIWGPTPAQQRYERNADAAWPPTAEDQRNHVAYNLGNVNKGDGFNNRGRGLIDVTGAINRAEVADHFGVVPSALSAWLESPDGACRSAAWYWLKHHCNELADAGDFTGVTRAINGGTNGLQGRLAIYRAVCNSMGLA